MTPFLEALVQHGALGIVTAIAVAYSWNLHKRYARVQDRRVDDAKAVTDTLLRLNDKWGEVITDNTRAMQSLERTVELLRETLGTRHG